MLIAMPDSLLLAALSLQGLERWLWWLGGLFIALLVGVHVLAQLSRRNRLPRSDGQSGTATIEFALVLPILMFLCMMLLQVMLALTGNMFVHYAAFAAVRTAIVQIPADSLPTAEPPNMIWVTDGIANREPGKMDTIARAAAYAMIPVSGQAEAFSGAADQYAQGLDRMFQTYGQTPPRWTRSLAPNRYQYALEHTQVRLLRAQPMGEFRVNFEPILPGLAEFAANEAVTVEVIHRLNLSIPFVRHVFADGTQMTADGEIPFARIAARSTLTNEGVSILMPEPTVVPRRPQ